MKKRIFLCIVLLLLSNTMHCFANTTMTYTREELQQAQQKAEKLWNELELLYVGMGENKLIAAALEWTEEEKKIFKEITGIQNVIFFQERIYPNKDQDPDETNSKYITTPMYVAKVEKDDKILVKNRVGVVNDEVLYDTISFQQKPYLKNGNMMIPLKEMIEIENQRRGFAEKVLYEIEQSTMTFHENKIIFYDGKRDVMINGIKMGLCEVPDITQNDIFISTQDLNMIFDGSGPYEKAYGRWEFAMKLEGTKGIYLNHKLSPKRNVTISIEQGENILLINGRKSNRFSGYVKNNHGMIAVMDIERFAELFFDTNVETMWNGEKNTATLKLWYDMAKDVVFTKDSNKMLVNGVEVEMEQAAEIKENRMYIPITALCNILDIK